ncbi:hypothetical protein [Natronorubrum sp. DTA7]|uniref:hypothetical protein n=1 Tax=Natronorubrum sp. DTA7 TaxID=3447016 RepID=UPI003F82779F
MTIDLPASLADSWRALGTQTGESSVLLASITAETTVYEPTDTADRLAALGASEIPVRSLFTVDVRFSPALSDLGMAPESAFEKAAPKAKSQFVTILEDEGLRVDGTRNTLEFEATNGAEGTWFVLDADYPVSPDLTAGEDEWLDAEAHIAVWPTEASFGMAGGILPLEDGSDVVDGDGATDGGDLPAGLEVDPESDRETVADLIRTIEPAD